MLQTNLNSDKKRNKVLPELFNSRLIITCIFSLIALTLYLGGFLNFPALVLIVAGALWNFFTDLNSFISFMLCLLVCVLFAMFAIIEGLYMNAILYFMFYIPLQFVVWLTNLDNKDMSISKDKRLFKKGLNYEFIAIVSVVFGLCVLCIYNAELTLSVLDAVSACILGFSALLQNNKFREYYLIRPIAVLISIVLWVAVIFINGFTMISFTMVLLYVMYLTNDLITSIYWKVTVDKLEPEEVEIIGDKGSKELEKERLKEYEELVRLENKNKNDKGGSVTA